MRETQELALARSGVSHFLLDPGGSLGGHDRGLGRAMHLEGGSGSKEGQQLLCMREVASQQRAWLLEPVCAEMSRVVLQKREVTVTFS